MTIPYKAKKGRHKRAVATRSSNASRHNTTANVDNIEEQHYDHSAMREEMTTNGMMADTSN